MPRTLPDDPVLALFVACRDGDEPRARALIELGASFERGSAGQVVVQRGSDELFELALEHGLPRTGPGAIKVLEAAIQHGRAARLERLLERGATLAGLTLPLHFVMTDPPAHVIEARARREGIDVLLAHGADIDEIAPVGASPLGWAIDRGRADAALHLLERGASVSGGAELHAAFVAGMTSLARRLVDRGAPSTTRVGSGFTVEEIVEPDLVTPREVTVRYRASAEPQRVRVVLDLARLSSAEPYGWEGRLREEASTFRRLGALGLLAPFGPAPAASFVEERGPTFTPRGGERFEVVQEMTLTGVAPSGLALVLRALCHGTLSYPARIVVEGEHEPRDDELSVGSERARRWFREPGLDALELPSSLPFPVEDEPKDDLLVSVDHEPGAGRRISDALVELGSFVPPVGSPRPDRGASGPWLAIGPGKVGRRSTTVRAHLVGVDGSRPAFDPEATRVLVLATLAACGGVQRATWRLDPARWSSAAS